MIFELVLILIIIVTLYYLYNVIFGGGVFGEGGIFGKNGPIDKAFQENGVLGKNGQVDKSFQKNGVFDVIFDPKVPDKVDCKPGENDVLGDCRVDTYGNGVGYPWQFGDPAFDYSNAQKRCEKESTTGGCKQIGLIWYPWCKEGYHGVGCCLCEPDGGPRITKTSKERMVCPPKDFPEYTVFNKDLGLCYRPVG